MMEAASQLLKMRLRKPKLHMKNKSSTHSARRRPHGFINFRMLLGLSLVLSGVALAILAGKEGTLQRRSEPERYMPVPGADSGNENAALGQLEQYWRDR